MTRNDTSVTTNDQLQERERVLGLLEGVTPGEWQYRPWKHDDWGVVREEDGPHLALVRDGRVGDEEKTAHRKAGTDPYEANARLIAAAPELARKYAAALAELERLTAERDAYRAAVTLYAYRQTNYAPARSPDATRSKLEAAVEDATNQYGCDDCHGQTFEDGMVCCWTCGREMPQAVDQ